VERQSLGYGRSPVGSENPCLGHDRQIRGCETLQLAVGRGMGWVWKARAGGWLVRLAGWQGCGLGMEGMGWRSVGMWAGYGRHGWWVGRGVGWE